MKECRFIEQICVVGENEKFVGALIVPSFINLTDWATKHGVSARSNVDLAKSPEVYTLLKTEIEEINKQFGQIEKVKQFKLIADEWSIMGGELTPTMKVKRKYVIAKYQKEIDEMYQD